jgi:hypothetical protein
METQGNGRIFSYRNEKSAFTQQKAAGLLGNAWNKSVFGGGGFQGIFFAVRVFIAR